MALKKCKECGQEISSSARKCPHCGKRQKLGCLTLLGIVFGVLIILCIIIAVFSDKKSTPTSSSSSLEETQKGEKIQAKIGDTVEVGHFIYRVNSTKFKKSIGNEFINETADGIYLLVDLSLKNINKEEHTIDNSLFKLVDEENVEYETSTEGTTAFEMSGGESMFLKQCQPQIQTRGVLIFEVPDKERTYILRVTGGFWTGHTADIVLK